MTISAIFFKLLLCLQPDLVLLYNVINWIALCKNWVTALKVKVTVRVQNVSECWSG